MSPARRSPQPGQSGVEVNVAFVLKLENKAAESSVLLAPQVLAERRGTGGSQSRYNASQVMPLRLTPELRDDVSEYAHSAHYVLFIHDIFERKIRERSCHRKTCQPCKILET